MNTPTPPRTPRRVTVHQAPDGPWVAKIYTRGRCFVGLSRPHAGWPTYEPRGPEHAIDAAQHGERNT